MAFQAIVFAPTLRSGARICIADLDQVDARPPDRITMGTSLALRFGTCCPPLAEGQITAQVAADVAVLTVGATAWTIKRCCQGSGVTIPGIVAETWFVAAPA